MIFLAGDPVFDTVLNLQESDVWSLLHEYFVSSNTNYCKWKAYMHWFDSDMKSAKACAGIILHQYTSGNKLIKQIMQ